MGRSLSGITDFKDTAFDPDVLQYAADCLERIGEYEAEITRTLSTCEAVDQPVRIRIGAELELYNIAGGESFSKRLRQLAKANDVEEEREYEAKLGKDDSFMPKAGQQPSLDRAFFSGLSGARHVRVDREPAFRPQIATEVLFSQDGRSYTIDRIALFQHEIISPPRSPYGLGIWLAAIGQRIIDRSSEYGLKRSEILTTLHDMSSSSLHLHISLIGRKDGKEVNLLQRDSFAGEKGTRKNNPACVSQLGLHIGFAINDFLRNYIYLFAPTNDAYVRFSDQQFVGTSFIGFTPRRVRFNMGSAMFRGEGRETFRAEDVKGVPDEGDLRIELRVPDVGSMGHPDKRHYHKQLAAPFDVSEALVFMLYRGVANWADERRLIELEGRQVVPKTEDALYQQQHALPKSAGEAATLLRNAQKSSDGFLTGKRAELIIQRGLQQQEINYLDRKPNLPRGQNQDRSRYLARGV